MNVCVAKWTVDYAVADIGVFYTASCCVDKALEKEARGLPVVENCMCRSAAVHTKNISNR